MDGIAKAVVENRLDVEHTSGAERADFHTPLEKYLAVCLGCNLDDFPDGFLTETVVSAYHATLHSCANGWISVLYVKPAPCRRAVTFVAAPGYLNWLLVNYHLLRLYDRVKANEFASDANARTLYISFGGAYDAE